MNKNEWELLCIAEDIEAGDTVRVEIHQAIQDMVYVGLSSSHTVILVDLNGVKRTFKAKTLEGWGGPGYILGKSKNTLKLPRAKRPG